MHVDELKELTKVFLVKILIQAAWHVLGPFAPDTAR